MTDFPDPAHPAQMSSYDMTVNAYLSTLRQAAKQIEDAPKFDPAIGNSRRLMFRAMNATLVKSKAGMLRLLLRAVPKSTPAIREALRVLDLYDEWAERNPERLDTALADAPGKLKSAGAALRRLERAQ